MTHSIKAGDFVGYVFAQPGNDTTYMVVRSIEDEKADCYDPAFDFRVKVDASKLWKMSERELNSGIGFSGPDHSFSVNYRELLEAAKDSDRSIATEKKKMGVKERPSNATASKP